LSLQKREAFEGRCHNERSGTTLFCVVGAADAPCGDKGANVRVISVVMAMVWTLAGEACAAGAITLKLSSVSEGLTSINASYGNVRNVDLAGPAIAGATYDDGSLQQVEYGVSGGLSTNPPTQSGVSNFALNRTPTGDGIITPAKPVFQRSSIEVEGDAGADLFDGLQLKELVADETGLILEVNVREFERLDRARYHPPVLQAYANNSSGSTSTTNPGTEAFIEVDVGEKPTTGLDFEINGTPVVTNESRTGMLLAVGLALFAHRRRRSSERDSGSS
jgi:MYXO-CTERM domain-containing protein